MRLIIFLTLTIGACSGDNTDLSSGDMDPSAVADNSDLTTGALDAGLAAADLLADACKGITCVMPPAPSCVSATSLRTYLAGGMCSNGNCDYISSDYPCPNGCQSGACQPGPAAWPMVGFDATHAGHCPYHGPTSNGSQWIYKTGGAIDSQPVIGSDGTLYVGSADGKLHAVNPDGTPRWIFATGGEIHSSPAVAADGTVYVSSGDGKLYAVDTTGKEAWHFQTGAPIDGSSPVFDSSGTVYVASTDKSLYAISPSGAKQWSFAGGEASSLTASVASDGTIYWYPGVVGNLLALNAQGVQKWSFACHGGWFDSSPVVNGFGHVYIVDETSLAVGAFDDVASDGTGTTTLIGVNLQVALDPLGNIVWASNDWDSPGWSLRVSSPAGLRKWSTAVSGYPTAPPTVDTDGKIYLPTDEGLNAYKGSDGTPLWTFVTPDGALTSAAIGPDGIAYVGHKNGQLYAVGP